MCVDVLCILRLRRSCACETYDTFAMFLLSFILDFEACSCLNKFFNSTLSPCVVYLLYNFKVRKTYTLTDATLPIHHLLTCLICIQLKTCL